MGYTGLYNKIATLHSASFLHSKKTVSVTDNHLYLYGK